jgi:hypothetical protein
MALTDVTLSLTERNGFIVLLWSPDDTPIVSWEIYRNGSLAATLLDVNAVTWTDYDVENNHSYSYVVTGTTDAISSSAAVGVPNPRAYGVIDPLETSIRYTSLSAVKDHINVNSLDDTYDATLTQVIVAVEVAIDQHTGRSFPDPSAGEIEGIPEAIKQVALSASIAAYNNTEAPAGAGGSDDWFGEQEDSIGEIIRREVRRSPLLMGYKISFGVAGGGSR